ncbi:LabA-like NYN domain-containing protein [Lyngbya confervoides]|uniref:NYN domain-containing protein n=1 Tax=Lyngbya confervoides BDU141951 TaxID=1574623 RepID=A0ABD4T3K1_9CYAN|nr:NYN domain-containing protein [Lyngbya confervoides]MCM1983023.1 NYN domain-containing protein [Lyngbya confervoides BDU141951]
MTSLTPQSKLSAHLTEKNVITGAILSAIAGVLFQQTTLTAVPLGITLLLTQTQRRSNNTELRKTLRQQTQSTEQIYAQILLMQQQLKTLQNTKPAAEPTPLIRQHTTPIIQQIHRLQRQQKALELSHLPAQQQQFTHLYSQLQTLTQTLQQSVTTFQDTLSSQTLAPPPPATAINATPPLPKDQTVVLIDGSNLYHSAKGLGYKIDYPALLTYLHTEYPQAQIRFYAGVDPKNIGQRSLYRSLRTAGCTLITKPVIARADGSWKANLDVEIALDMYATAASAAKIVLFSGDGDFVCAVRRVKQQKTQVQVIGLPGSTSQKLKKTAHQYQDLSQLPAILKPIPTPPASQPADS